MITPWYKEPWAWLVFFLPFSAVVAGITTFIIANDDPDPLVIGDYYKKGKAINFEISKIKQAQKLGIRFSMQVDGNALLIKPSGIETVFPLLNVNFYHPTQVEKDFYLALTPDGNGFFRHQFDNAPLGKFKVTISPFDDKWKIQNTVYLPQKQFVEITPKTNEAN